MFSRTLSWLKTAARNSEPARAKATAPSFRPNLDTLEDRVVLSITPLVNLPIDVGNVTSVVNTVNGQQVTQLTAPITIAGQQAGNLVMDATTSPVAQQGDCPVLNLEIQPIHLNVLGLHVDTSNICLDLTAQHGQGVLGDVLCSLAGGQTLAQIIDQLDDVASNLGTFLNGIQGVLDGGPLASQIGVLDQAMTVTGVFNSGLNGGTGHQDTQGSCNILNLSLGPIDLNLLGLNVSVDNCGGNTQGGQDGPVTVDITAVHTGQPQGGLLGDLLCGLADGGLAGVNLNRLVGRLDSLIDSLGNLADRLDDISDLPSQFTNLANRLIDQVQKVADRVDSLSDLDRLTSRIDKVVNRLDKLIDNTDISSRLVSQLNRTLTLLTRIINRFEDLGAISRASASLERIIDRVLAQL